MSNQENIYIALKKNGPMSVSQIMEKTKLSAQIIIPILKNQLDFKKVKIGYFIKFGLH